MARSEGIVIARSEATKQSRGRWAPYVPLYCFARVAMTAALCRLNELSSRGFSVSLLVSPSVRRAAWAANLRARYGAIELSHFSPLRLVLNHSLRRSPGGRVWEAPLQAPAHAREIVSLDALRDRQAALTASGQEWRTALSPRGATPQLIGVEVGRCRLHRNMASPLRKPSIITRKALDVHYRAYVTCGNGQLPLVHSLVAFRRHRSPLTSIRGENEGARPSAGR